MVAEIPEKERGVQVVVHPNFRARLKEYQAAYFRKFKRRVSIFQVSRRLSEGIFIMSIQQEAEHQPHARKFFRKDLKDSL